MKRSKNRHFLHKRSFGTSCPDSRNRSSNRTRIAESLFRICLHLDKEVLPLPVLNGHLRLENLKEQALKAKRWSNLIYNTYNKLKSKNPILKFHRPWRKRSRPFSNCGWIPHKASACNDQRPKGLQAHNRGLLSHLFLKALYRWRF